MIIILKYSVTKTSNEAQIWIEEYHVYDRDGQYKYSDINILI